MDWQTLVQTSMFGVVFVNLASIYFVNILWVNVLNFAIACLLAHRLGAEIEQSTRPNHNNAVDYGRGL